MNNTTSLLMACSILAILTLLVGVRMLVVRVKQMKKNNITPQSVALSAPRAEIFQDSKLSDNYNHLFELPVLFYVLCALAIASQQIPNWLPIAAYLFVVSRIIHSIIQCTYNKVMHRFAIFLVGLATLIVMWVSFIVSNIVNM
jgi:hypothetical protein